MSVEVVEDLLDHASVDMAFLAPSTLEEISQSQSLVEKLKKVKTVETGGGLSIPPIAWNFLS